MQVLRALTSPRHVLLHRAAHHRHHRRCRRTHLSPSLVCIECRSGMPTQPLQRRYTTQNSLYLSVCNRVSASTNSKCHAPVHGTRPRHPGPHACGSRTPARWTSPRSPAPSCAAPCSGMTAQTEPGARHSYRSTSVTKSCCLASILAWQTCGSSPIRLSPAAAERRDETAAATCLGSR